MHTYEWKKQYYIGLDLIDSEHSNLFACINKLVIAQHFEQSIILSLAKFAAYVNEIKPLPNSPKAKLKEIVLTHKI